MGKLCNAWIYFLFRNFGFLFQYNLHIIPFDIKPRGFHCIFPPNCVKYDQQSNNETQCTMDFTSIVVCLFWMQCVHHYLNLCVFKFIYAQLDENLVIYLSLWAGYVTYQHLQEWGVEHGTWVPNYQVPVSSQTAWLQGNSQMSACSNDFFFLLGYIYKGWFCLRNVCDVCWHLTKSLPKCLLTFTFINCWIRFWFFNVRYYACWGKSSIHIPMLLVNFLMICAVWTFYFIWGRTHEALFPCDHKILFISFWWYQHSSLGLLHLPFLGYFCTFSVSFMKTSARCGVMWL